MSRFRGRCDVSVSTIQATSEVPTWAPRQLAAAAGAGRVGAANAGTVPAGPAPSWLPSRPAHGRSA
jgi:hypothetical protein